MRKHFLLLIFIAFASSAQTGRAIRIGYIDMEYILENVPEYNEANIQLEQKAQKWKQEMETKKNEISKLKESLKTEQVLLTKELIQERQDEITFLENELMEYQQKRFGPTGELVVQKAVLVKPIQDQIFTAVQDLAEAKKYDFIFDKSSDLTMLFAAKRYDVSDYVIRTLTRASKRNQMSKKQIKEEEAKEYKENLEDLNPELAARQKALEDRKAAREKMLADRKAAFEAKRQEAEANKLKLQEERNAKKAGTTTPPPTNTDTDTDKKGPNTTETPKATATAAVSNGETSKKAETTAVVPTKATTEADKKAPKTSDTPKTTTSVDSKKITDPKPVEDKEATKKAAAEAQKKVIEDRKKTIEDRKKAIEERKAKVLAEREAAKKAKEEELKAKEEDQKEKTNN